ncbi:tRNA modification GTPase TrmE [Lapidilactobacillus dextrinicus DSM 20335]|uniref:tRNA modification GTPase MnmE n=1 Tax=Lapidilactobacillus dextrinicus DSM 20335 TaxID=1423738 RepID=A0A0R2BHB0_9LACO|nr:tRNA uridine-5-carboxymethylaminomethyl(34) synthesis GTPase MnmE [Lapidilactobacillus dextrinicus]KRM78910.1 tRNA modification GTPase TrmE [Lapidilactobacillus dextrinicus DSM 20335]QFG47542.1 tRNA uridine-5-carboxymethylaminomethyl(34) synthesis GTPase MnmE [Lapidilactobacillus dextrinicus]
MLSVTEYDTIAAISTPPGEGAISIVRLSGEDAIKIANQVFRGKNLTKVASHTIHYGHIIDPTTKQELDEVMASVMRTPKTFTREDIVEINCHGGIVPTNKILQLLLANGARLAEPGEFTKRAFLNGRIDLTQAESVMDLIRAKTDRSMQVALNQLDGNLQHLIHHLRQDISDVLVQVEVNIDYPEYDEDEVTAKLLMEKAIEVKARIQQLLATAQQGKILRDGLATAIIGRPNVGKSSLLNYLLQEDKAIVTDVAGTTRDVLEEYVNVQGVPLKLIDTAGIHETDDKVEKIGVERSKKALSGADLIILVLDASEPLTAEDRELLEMTREQKRIIILNKSDLPQKISPEQLARLGVTEDPIVASVKDNQGIAAVEQEIKTLFFGGIENRQQDVLVSNNRQIGLLEQAEVALDSVISGLNANMPIDLVQIDMTTCWEKLGEITGENAPDELITQLFSQFCLGK